MTEAENMPDVMNCPLEDTLARLNTHRNKCQNSIDDGDFVNKPQHLFDEYNETEKDIEAIKRVRDMGYFREWKKKLARPIDNDKRASALKLLIKAEEKMRIAFASSDKNLEYHSFNCACRYLIEHHSETLKAALVEDDHELVKALEPLARVYEVSGMRNSKTPENIGIWSCSDSRAGNGVSHTLTLADCKRAYDLLAAHRAKQGE